MKSDIPGSYGTLSPWLKLTTFVNRLPAVATSAFETEWLKHGEMMAKLPGLQKLALGLVDHNELTNFPFDAVSESFYTSEAAYDASGRDRDSELAPALERHARQLFASKLQLFTQEIVLLDFKDGQPPAGAVKRISLMRRKPELTREKFLEDWRDVHARGLEGMPGMIRYTINVQIPRLNPDMPYDGYAEIWWDSHANYFAGTSARDRRHAADAASGKQLPGLPVVRGYFKPSTPLWR